jgi:DNA helicase-2/ATP-dependent DNA helicase PcrA
VFVVNAVDGCIPSDLGTGCEADIEEERRLLYVAMTRAKDSLDLVLPQRLFTHSQRVQGDRHVYASRTRFMPRDILAKFEQVSWSEGTKGTGFESRATGLRVDVAAQMRRMWQKASV